MSKDIEDQLKTHLCANPGCWRTRSMSEAQVVADLGGPWRLLLLDAHFSRCVPANKRKGGLCDAVATYPEDSNDKLKLVELKQSLADLPSAKRQLATGGKLVAERLPRGIDGMTVEAELHVRLAPRSTLKTRDTVMVGTRKVPIRAFRQGARV